MSEKYKITFEVQPEEATNSILGLLRTIETLSIIGASRSFGIKDPSNQEEKDVYFFFDGDGNHRLNNIEVKKILP